jgi:predicted small integral membrane protein
MSNSQLAKTTELISGMMLTVAVAVVAVGTISFLVARRLGGQSKPKRQAIFTLVSGMGFLCIMCFVYLRISGRA